MKQLDVGASLETFRTAINDLLDAQLEFYGKFADTLDAAMPAMPAMPKIKGCDCTIPEPCWMPHAIGERTSRICAGASATLKVKITNCDRVKRTFTVSAAGEGAGYAKITPTTLALGPKESGHVSVVFTAPASSKDCESFETLIWVLGCNEHYLKWNVTIGHDSKHACIDVCVEDCPDYVHHWYDHFYCLRPCFGRRDTGAAGKSNA